MTNPEPQPLKDKTIAIIQTDPWDEGGKFPRGFFKRDIKAAIDWLKVNIMKASDHHMYAIDEAWCNNFLFPLVDKAFEDVIKRKRLY